MPNRASIRDWVRQQTLVESDDFGDGKLNNVINEGIREISTRFDWPWLATSAQITAVADQQAYALPADHARTHSIVLRGANRRLREVAPSAAWNEHGDSMPTGDSTHSFFLWANSLYLLPVPVTGTTNVYDHYYFKAPATLENDVDEPEFASQFHLVVANFAISKVWEREEDFVKASAADDQFDEGVERMARFYLDRALDAPLIMGERRDYLAGRRSTNTPWLDGV